MMWLLLLFIVVVVEAPIAKVLDDGIAAAAADVVVVVAVDAEIGFQFKWVWPGGHPLPCPHPDIIENESSFREFTILQSNEFCLGGQIVKDNRKTSVQGQGSIRFCPASKLTTVKLEFSRHA